MELRVKWRREGSDSSPKLGGGTRPSSAAHVQRAPPVCATCKPTWGRATQGLVLENEASSRRET